MLHELDGEYISITDGMIYKKKGSNLFLVIQGNLFYLSGRDHPNSCIGLNEYRIFYRHMGEGIIIKGRYYIKPSFWNSNWTTPYKIEYPFLECANPLIEELWNGIK